MRRAALPTLAVLVAACAAAPPPAPSPPASASVEPDQPGASGGEGCALVPSGIISPANQAPDDLSEIWFENRLGCGYRMQRVMLGLDGALVFDGADPSWGEGPGRPEQLLAFRGTLSPGRHQALVKTTFHLPFRGWNTWSCLSGFSYRFDARYSFSFDVPIGGARRARITAFERGSVITPIEQRPALRCEIEASAEGS